MLKKILKLKPLFIVVFVIILLILPVYFTKIYFFTGEQKISNLVPIVASTTISYEQGDVDFGSPMQIKIPSIGVDAVIEKIGVTPQGEVGVPKGPTDAAWFDLGPHPGEKGSAVIVGHYGWKDGISAVFDNLYKLQNGDKIFVKDEKGRIVTFVVRESRRYDPEADASAVFISNDDKSHLNLITCEGVWNKDQKSYSKRLVVFTDKE